MLHQSSPLLACMVTLFLYGTFLFFVLEGDIRNTPDCPGRNNSHFALENEDSKCPLSFQYGILPGSCPLYLCPANSFQDKFCSNKLEILTGTSSDFSDISSDISAPWAHESNSPFVDRKSKTLECWLATQTHLLQHRHMLCNKRIGVICQGASSALHFCLQGSKGTAFKLFSPYSFPLSVSCRQLSRHSVRKNWEFSLEAGGISPTYQVT